MYDCESPVPGRIKAEDVTESLANEMLSKWIKRLRLEEWDIVFRWNVPAREMFEPESCGCAKAQVVSRQAIIQMLRAEDYDNDLFTYDYEKTLVHELLHLAFWDMDDTGDKLRDHLTHCMVDRIAKALVAADRGLDRC